jgi:hypothetical protein
VKVDEHGRSVPEAGDKLCYHATVLIDPEQPSEPFAKAGVPEEATGERWVHGICVGVLERGGVAHSVCIRTPDGVVHVVGRDDWRFSDL